METTELIDRQKQALALVEQLIELNPDGSTLAYALKMRERLKLPMSVVLSKLWPEIPLIERCRKLGISKQTYFGWLNGLYRPDNRRAKKLAKETGFSAEDIRGKL
jgi:transcriptional regulator with XRE-family HTH domain